MKPVRTLIVVADGEHARFLIHEGIGHGLKAAVDKEMYHHLPPSRDIVSEREGRAATPLGTPGRHTLSYTVDYHAEEKVRFAREVADFVSKMRAADRFDRLVLVAPPKALGNLREALDDKTKALVQGELAKDLVRVSPRDLEAPLGEVMAV